MIYEDAEDGDEVMFYDPEEDEPEGPYTPEPEPEPEPLPEGRKRQSPKCSICGQRGHRAPTCPLGPAKKDTPPRGRGKDAVSKDTPPTREATLAQLADIETQIEVMYVMFAQLWSVKDPTCGGALAANAKPMAKSWVEWARQDPKVAKVLTSMSHGAGVFGVVVAHLPFAMVVFQHHGPAAQAARQQENLEAAVKHEAQMRGVPEEVIWDEVRAAQQAA